jgi:hypothetical protein
LEKIQRVPDAPELGDLVSCYPVDDYTGQFETLAGWRVTQQITLVCTGNGNPAGNLIALTNHVVNAFTPVQEGGTRHHHGLLIHFDTTDLRPVAVIADHIGSEDLFCDLHVSLAPDFVTHQPGQLLVCFRRHFLCFLPDRSSESHF